MRAQQCVGAAIKDGLGCKRAGPHHGRRFRCGTRAGPRHCVPSPYPTTTTERPADCPRHGSHYPSVERAAQRAGGRAALPSGCPNHREHAAGTERAGAQYAGQSASPPPAGPSSLAASPRNRSGTSGAGYRAGRRAPQMGARRQRSQPRTPPAAAAASPAARPDVLLHERPAPRAPPHPCRQVSELETLVCAACSRGVEAARCRDVIEDAVRQARWVGGPCPALRSGCRC